MATISQSGVLNGLPNNGTIKPFLKWAGGKTQILPALAERLPDEIIETGKIQNYCEPFLGSGAFFLYLKSYFEIKRAYLSDMNPELIILWRAIQKNGDKIVEKLARMEGEFIPLDDERRKEYYYNIRDEYNSQRSDIKISRYSPAWIERGALMIFLNRTCFNGLFRVNSKGEFNVPYGRYKNPKICIKKQVLAAQDALKGATIKYADFEECRDYVGSGDLVYFDPPYRPISKTSSFTSYSSGGFDDDDQRRLAKLFNELTKKRTYLILSNSDPKNIDPSDEFFDELYKKHTISRVPARRAINCDASRRGSINELIITNFRDGWKS